MTPGSPNPLDAENPRAIIHNQHHAWFPFNIPQSAWQVQDADEEVRSKDCLMFHFLFV